MTATRPLNTVARLAMVRLNARIRRDDADPVIFPFSARLSSVGLSFTVLVPSNKLADPFAATRCRSGHLSWNGEPLSQKTNAKDYG